MEPGLSYLDSSNEVRKKSVNSELNRSNVLPCRITKMKKKKKQKKSTTVLF